MRWWRAGMRRQMWLYAAVCLVVTTGVFAVAQVAAGRARAGGQELAERLLPSAQAVEQMLTTISSERRNLRDFVLTDNPVRRDEYEQARSDLPAQVARARGLLASERDTFRRFQAVLAAQQDWSTKVERPVVLALASGETARAKGIVNGPGLALSKPYSDAVDDLRAQLHASQQAVLARLRDQQQVLLAALLGCLAIMIGMVVGTYVALRRNVLTPFLAIGHAVDRVAAGEHERRVPATGPLELAALGGSVETMRVRLLEALNEAETAELNFRQLLESSPDAAVQLSGEGVIVAINAQAERLFGHPREELLGRPLETLVPAGLRERHEEHRDAWQGERRTLPMSEGLELTALHRDGHEIPAEVTLSVIPTAQGLLVSAAVRDVSERRAAQAERERLIAEAEAERYERRLAQSQRLESLGQLVGGVAHDFNNLLNIILGYSGFVTKQLREPPDSGTWDATRDDVEQIHDAAERASRLTHQLLAFGRREVVKPEIVSLNDVVDGLEQLLRRTLGEHIDLVITLEPQAWLVKADPGQLEQVLVNLSVNARDAMPAGGKLTVDTSNVDVDAAYAHSRPGLEPGRYVRLRVCDTGTGMDKETMRRVFEPFFSTKPKGQGTGLGLATVYGIITQAGGHPQLYSEVGLGTTFAALLPATDELQEFRERTAVRAAPSQGESVLLVEDEEPLRELVDRILRNAAYRVLVADTPAHALELAGDLDRPIDLLLTDVVMPGMLGKELAARIGELRPGLRVLYMSGYAHEVLHSQGTLEPGVELLEKPFTEADLLARLRTTLERDA